jgi:DNA-binding NtrC family response regulator
MAAGVVSDLPVLIVDDEIAALNGFTFTLEAAGVVDTIACQDSREVLDLLAEREIGVVLLDLSMPEVSGRELLPRIVESYPEVPVIVVTGINDVETAVGCLKAGAFDYMVKPVGEGRLVTSVRRAVELRELRLEYSSFRRRVLAGELENPEAFAEIVTANPQMRSIFQYIETIARSSMPVLVSGETGVGKELITRAIHACSGLSGPLVTVNVAGLDDNMFADTLFGHLKGAYTGAERARDGLVKSAEGGTLLMDEVGDLRPESQVKLLRLIQEREYFPLGADVPRLATARIVVSTNRDLEAAKRDGRFRADLYYRLHTHHIRVPRLADRPDDLPLLVNHFLQKAATELAKPRPTPPKELYPLLATYHFPGNVRELESLVFDAVSKHRARMLSMKHFADYIDEHRDGPAATPTIAGQSPFSLFEELPTLKKAQQQLIDEAMRRADQNQTLAAKLLGISQPGLSKAIKRREK